MIVTPATVRTGTGKSIEQIVPVPIPMDPITIAEKEDEMARPRKIKDEETKSVPAERFLLKTTDGYRYPYTDALAKRADMVECDKKGNPLYNPEANDKAQIELQGKMFMVELPLHEILIEMGNAMAQLQEDNKELKRKLKASD